VGSPVLDGKVAFVAGASRGIGRDVARALAAAGAGVVVAARSETEGKLSGTIHSVADGIRATGGDAFPVVCDVSSEESVTAAVDEAVRHYGGLDVLVANAGVVWLPKVLDTPLKRWELCMRINLTGVFLVTKAVMPHVMARGRGSLIAITTTGVPQVELGSNAYWASKAGVERLYAGLAVELAPHNVAVNCLAPNKVVMTEGAIAGGMQVPDDMIEAPEAMGAAAVWLASQDASGVTGTVQYSLDVVERLGLPLAPLPVAE